MISVLFDVLGVLVAESKIVSQTLPRFLAGRGHELSGSQVERITDCYKNEYKLGLTSPEEFWQVVGAYDVDQIEQDFVNSWTLGEGLGDCITMLQNLGSPYCIVSELPRAWGELVVERAGLRNTIAGAVYSSDTHAPKTDSSTFDEVEAILGPRNSILYVDDKEKNLEVAKRWGCGYTVLFSDDARRDRSLHAIDYLCSSLSHIPGLVSRANSGIVTERAISNMVDADIVSVTVSLLSEKNFVSFADILESTGASTNDIIRLKPMLEQRLRAQRPDASLTSQMAATPPGFYVED